MNYPLLLEFKMFSLSTKIVISDATGQIIMFAKQKMFKLKESISVFSDEAMTQQLYTIDANKVIDFSAQYNFTDMHQQPIGAVRRKGIKSIWKAHYEIVKNDQIEMIITEEDPWVKFFDALLSSIPFLNFISGYVFHPSYLVHTESGKEIMRLKKLSSFLERKFSIEKLDQSLNEKDDKKVLLSLFMLVLLERPR